MIEIIPALLVHDQQTFEYRLKQVLPLCDYVQVDILDGTFVHNHSWFNTVNLIEEDFDIKYWLHLMVDDPIKYIVDFPKVEIRHIKGVTAHLESLDEDSLEVYVNLLNSMGLEVGVASVNDFSKSSLDLQQYGIDEILVLGVDPGLSGQDILKDTNERIGSAKGKVGELIAVDGGVNANNIGGLIDSGASKFYISSYIFDNENPRKVITDLRSKFV